MEAVTGADDEVGSQFDDAEEFLGVVKALPNLEKSVTMLAIGTDQSTCERSEE